MELSSIRNLLSSEPLDIDVKGATTCVVIEDFLSLNLDSYESLVRVLFKEYSACSFVSHGETCFVLRLSGRSQTPYTYMDVFRLCARHKIKES